MNRYDAWAAHAVSHCKEMTGKYEEGIKFMTETENNWSVSISYISCSLLFITLTFPNAESKLTIGQIMLEIFLGRRGGLVVEGRTPERERGFRILTQVAVLCP